MQLNFSCKEDSKDWKKVIERYAYSSTSILLDIVMGFDVDLGFYDPNNTTKEGFNGTEAMDDMYERLKQST